MSERISIKLPNAMRIWVPKAAAPESKFIYREIFDDRCYEQCGIAPSQKGVVLDVGANVGLFALRMKQLAPSCRVYSFEPAPPTNACLRENVELEGVEVLDVALSDRPGTMDMTFFPRTPASSTLFPGEKSQEVSSMADNATLQWMWQLDRMAAVLLAVLYPVRRMILRKSFRRLFESREVFTCETRTLDDFLDERGIDAVDLLKVDV